MGLFDGSWYNPAGFIGNAGDLKKFAGSKTGSLFSGRAILQGGPKDQDMEKARTFDVFGSPATAGTNQQSTARLGALLYGAWMGAGALGAGALGGGGATGMSAAPSAAPGGAGAMGTGGFTGGGLLNYLNMARRGYGAYNMLNNMGGGQQQAPQQQFVGNPYSMNASPYFGGQQAQAPRAWYYG